ncbi:hypothetical protein ACFL2T_06645 [Elusimicrobiota bacterium]
MRRIPTLPLAAAPLLAAVFLSACGGPHEIRYPQTRTVDCPRGHPQQILNRRNRDVLSVNFKPRSTGRAIESARIRGNIRLTIHHRGCDKVQHTFVFEVKDRYKPLGLRSYWYGRAARLLEQVTPKSPSADGLRVIAAKLKAASADPPPYGAPMTMDDYQSLSLQMGEGEQGRGTQLRIRYTLKI